MERQGRFFASRQQSHLSNRRTWRNRELQALASSSKKMQRLPSSQGLIKRCCITNKHCSNDIFITNIRHPRTAYWIRAKSNAEAEVYSKHGSNLDSSSSEAPAQREDMELDLKTSSATYQVKCGEIFEGLTNNVVTPDSTSKGHGTLQGAIALVIGTSVGAGILALPVRTAHAGFVPTTTTMIICWSFLVLEALILAEVNVALLGIHARSSSTGGNSRILSICAMAEETLGPLGGLVSAFIYCFLSYTVMVAYIAKSGDVLSPIMNISPSCGRWVFTFVLGGLVFFGGTGFADIINQIMTFSLVGVFCAIIVGGWTLANWSELQHMDWWSAPDALPVILFALVYHDLMPVLCTYLKGDLFRIRLAVLLGSGIPLVMFAIWNAVILCIAPLSGEEDPLDFLMRSGGTGLAILINLFSVFALATSLIGTLLGFMEFFREKFGHKLKERTGEGIPSTTNVFSRSSGQVSDGADESRGLFDVLVNWMVPVHPFFHILHDWWAANNIQVLVFFLILAPPLAISAVVSNAFFSATDLAGGYGMTALYGLFPPAMAWSLFDQDRSPRKNKQAGFSLFSMSEPQAKTLLAGTTICALGIVFSQFGLDFGHGT